MTSSRLVSLVSLKSLVVPKQVNPTRPLPVLFGVPEWQTWFNDQSSFYAQFSFHSIYHTRALSFERIYLFIFRERGRGGETLMCKRYIDQLPFTHPQLGIWPATQACALTGNQTSDLWFTGQHSIHWATPARDQELFLKTYLYRTHPIKDTENTNEFIFIFNYTYYKYNSK